MVFIDVIGLGNEVAVADFQQTSCSASPSSFCSIVINRLLKELETTVAAAFNLDGEYVDRVIRPHFGDDGFEWSRRMLQSMAAAASADKDEAELGIFTLNFVRSKNCANNLEIRDDSQKSKFDFSAPTTSKNLGRIIRALQLNRAILLEGPPGAGKTAIVEALAKLTGNKLIRINLSEQTDLMDLLGSELPTASRMSLWSGQAKNDDEGFDVSIESPLTDNQIGANNETKNCNDSITSCGIFKWYDGVLLRAMQTGAWVVLDELNLASQPVLEGLNALLDHRREIYIPELDRHVHCGSTFRLFASQNPTSGGGGRKGLPRSFLNRFSVIAVEQLNIEDFESVMSVQFDALRNEERTALIRLMKDVQVSGSRF